MDAKFDEVVNEIMSRLGYDANNGMKPTIEGHAKSVASILRGAGVPECRLDDPQYIEVLTLGVNDLLTMTAAGGDFSAGFRYLLNQMRMGGVKNAEPV